MYKLSRGIFNLHGVIVSLGNYSFIAEWLFIRIVVK